MKLQLKTDFKDSENPLAKAITIAHGEDNDSALVEVWASFDVEKLRDFLEGIESEEMQVLICLAADTAVSVARHLSEAGKSEKAFEKVLIKRLDEQRRQAQRLRGVPLKRAI